MKDIIVRIEGSFLFAIEPGDLEDDGISLTSAGHDRAVERFIAEYPELNRADLEIVDVDIWEEEGDEDEDEDG
jgi:hypothetical protein